ncbi:MAG: nuclear transport factor 2 family protein [Pseudomonadota bacterium]
MSTQVMSEKSAFEDEIRAFFAEYLEAFGRKDAAAISELWDEVGLFPSPTGNFSMDREAFRNHCTTLLDFYRRQGVAQPVGELLSVEELFPGVSQARMAYRMLGSDGADVASWEHVYILRKTDGQWRVSLTVADDEMAAWAASGAHLQ